MSMNDDEPPSINASSHNREDAGNTTDISHKPDMAPSSINKGHDQGGFFSWLFGRNTNKADPSLRETIEEFIEEEDATQDADDASISSHEKTMIANVLQLRDAAVVDVMVPRADIVALDINTTEQELLEFLAQQQFSRIPVYKDKLDDVLGTIHIKDVIATLAQGESISIEDLIREVPIISPSMPVMDLMLEMRTSRKHMAMVIDEYGGIDGLVTIGDIIEEIVGQIEDEHDTDEQPKMNKQSDDSTIADARVDLEEFTKEFGDILEAEELEENDTLGGLIFFMAGRVPARGEVLKHSSGLTFQILEADPRKVTKIKISQ